MSAAPLLLAHWWSRPTADERAWWADAWTAAAETDGELGTTLAAELRTVLEGSTGDELVEEYERLFVGPGRTPCPPYESLWRAGQPRREQGRLMATAAVEVAQVYRDLELRVSPEAHELPDHVVVEWEALAYSLEQGADVAADLLARAHLAQWMPAFCAAVGAETTLPFYRVLARLTDTWTAALAA